MDLIRYWSTISHAVPVGRRVFVATTFVLCVRKVGTMLLIRLIECGGCF